MGLKNYKKVAWLPNRILRKISSETPKTSIKKIVEQFFLQYAELLISETKNSIYSNEGWIHVESLLMKHGSISLTQKLHS